MQKFIYCQVIIATKIQNGHSTSDGSSYFWNSYKFKDDHTPKLFDSSLETEEVFKSCSITSELDRDLVGTSGA